MPLSEVLNHFPERGDPSLFESSSMGGAWGFPNELQSDTADLAYVVVSGSMDIRRIGMNVEVATRIGDTFLPTSYLTAKHFAVLDGNGNVIRPALVDVPPVVEEPVIPSEPPLVIIEEPWIENPEEFPVVVVNNPAEQPGEVPGEVPAIDDDPLVPPIRTVTWDPSLSVPTIDWPYITGWHETDFYADIDMTQLINVTAIDGDANTPLSLREAIAWRLADATSDPLYFGRNAWLANAAFDATAVSAPEPSSLILTGIVALTIAAARRRAA